MDERDQLSTTDTAATAVNEKKTPRSSCDLCKRMKIKCDWQNGSCKHCISRNVGCTVSPPQKRKKRIAKRADYFRALEDRIRQMEKIVDSAGVKSRLEEQESVVEQIDGQAGLSDRMSMLVMGEEGASQFIGPSSGFSLFSPHGIRWIRSKVGNYDIGNLVQAIDAGNKIRGDFSTLMWRSRSDNDQEPLPSKNVADLYVDAYFRVFSSIFPIFDEAKFRKLYERHYHEDYPAGAAWYSSLNAVFAVGSAILQDHLKNRTMHALVGHDSMSHDVCWKYFRNASSKFTDLVFQPGDILAIQAILCMALMCQVISDNRPTYILAGTAVRLAHSIGLHRNLADFGLSSLELKERQNVLWITYMLDAEISLKTGRPPAMNDQNIAVALPRAPYDGFDRFRSMATFALLEARVYHQLYSAEAGTRSALERLKRIGRLDTELTEWRDTLPHGYRPESEINCPEDQFIPVTMMHFSYYNCLTAIHRASIHHGAWTSESEDEDSSQQTYGEKLNPRVYLSSSLCLEAARNVVGLLKSFSHDSRQTGLIWMAIYYPLSAALTLFSNALQNPQSPEAISDVESISAVIDFLNKSLELSSQLERTIGIFTELNRIAGGLVQETQMARLNSLKMQYQESASPESHSSPSSRETSANQVVFPTAIGDNVAVPTVSHPGGTIMPFDPIPNWSADIPFDLTQSIPEFSADMWTETFPPDIFDEENLWYM